MGYNKFGRAKVNFGYLALLDSGHFGATKSAKDNSAQHIRRRSQSAEAKIGAEKK